MADQQQLNIKTHEEGIRTIDDIIVRHVKKFLLTGVFENKSNENFMKAYSIVYHLIDNLEKQKEVFDYYEGTIQDFSKYQVLKEFTGKTDESLLKEYLRHWSNHIIFVRWMQKLVVYLDRYFLKNAEKESLCQVGLNIYKRIVFDEVQGRLVDALIHLITKERDGELVDRQLIKAVLESYVKLGTKGATIGKTGTEYKWEGKDIEKTIYEQKFEEKFIQDTRMYYEKKANQWITTLNCPEYLKESEKSIEAEQDRADKYLDRSSSSKLLDIVITILVEKNAEKLAFMEGTGCEEMFKHKKLEELALMYRVFKRRDNTLKYIIAKMGPYIESRGDVIIQDENLLKDPIEFTAKLLDLKREMDEMVSLSFANDLKFEKCRDLSFQNFMNRCGSTAHYIAAYCDNEFRKGLKGANQQDIEKRLDSIIKLFCCLHARDVFLKSYTKYLSLRLLNKTSISDEAEQTMLAKLKVECGHNTVNKLSQMFTDIQISKDLMGEFQGKTHGGVVLGIQVNVEVLTSGLWPEQNTGTCKLPKELTECSRKFEEFYKYKYSGKHLTWLFNHGSVEIVPLFSKRKYNFLTSVYQACVLMLYNDGKTLTFSDIQGRTTLPPVELHAHLVNLYNPKVRLLKKGNEKKAQCEPNELIELNLEFQSSNVRCNFIPQKTHKKKPNEKDGGEEAKQEDKEIKLERQNIIDSVIVRIMKARKTEKHNDLMAEVMKQISMFMPQPQMIKSRIESLIEREYLKRDEENRGVYIYLP